MKEVKLPIQKVFPVNVFKHGIKIFFGSVEDLKKQLKKDGIDDKELCHVEDFGNAPMGTLCLSTGDAVIYGANYTNSINGQAILVHEIFHAVSYMLRNIGIEHSAETEEAYAYIIEDLTFDALTWLSSVFP